MNRESQRTRAAHHVLWKKTEAKIFILDIEIVPIYRDLLKESRIVTITGQP